MKKISLRAKLIRLFMVTSTIPILILGVFSFYNISRTLKENTELMSKSSLRQVDNNLNIRLESYEDLLYQIYTNDDVVTWIDNLDNGVDEAVTVNQLRRFLNTLLNTKEYIRAISIITPRGEVVTYEQMTPATYKSSWMDNYSMSEEDIYNEVIQDYDMHIFPTEYGTNFARKDYYLFHMAHRVIDYKKLDKECGIAILTLDEDFLKDVCMNPDQENRIFNFIADDSGRIITFGDHTEKIGAVIPHAMSGTSYTEDDYGTYYKNSYDQYGSDINVYVYHDDGLGWNIVNVTDMSAYISALKRQFLLILLLGAIVLTSAIFLSSNMSQTIVTSVKDVVSGMGRARGGDLSVRIEKDKSMPLEIESIADGFNDTMEKLEEAVTRQQEAQIVALEAQINPHFLYNTLDTINWMAIDKDEYDISNAISSLATILRYAIVNSNAEVTVKEEIDWLKKYVYLQQYRLKNNFSCAIHVDPEVIEARIHKLLLQPFVENAVKHGLEKKSENAELKVSVSRREENLTITIEDNGVGMSEDMINDINSGIFSDKEKGNGIGMRNAATRLEMYYGDSGRLRAEKAEPAGTRIVIDIPYRINPV